MERSERPTMSDTPRTDAEIPELSYRPYTLDWQKAQKFARQLERELADARKIASKYDDRYFATRELLTVSTERAERLERELNEAKREAARYEVVRKMNATQFAELLQRCLFQDLRFDDEVDKIGGIK